MLIDILKDIVIDLEKSNSDYNYDEYISELEEVYGSDKSNKAIQNQQINIDDTKYISKEGEY